MAKRTGFTLIELVVVLGIISIMAVIAFPSFSQQIMQEQVVSTANQLNSVYKFARSEAVKRNQQTKLIVNGSQWQVKATIDGVETELKTFAIAHQNVSAELVNLTLWSSGEVSAAHQILVKSNYGNTRNYYLCILKSGQNWLAEESQGCV